MDQYIYIYHFSNSFSYTYIKIIVNAAQNFLNFKQRIF